MENFYKGYEQQEKDNQIFLRKKLEKQIDYFTQVFNLQEQITSYYHNVLGFCEYTESIKNRSRNIQGIDRLEAKIHSVDS